MKQRKSQNFKRFNTNAEIHVDSIIFSLENFICITFDLKVSIDIKRLKMNEFDEYFAMQNVYDDFQEISTSNRKYDMKPELGEAFN